MKRAPWHRRLRPPATFDRSAVLSWTERISSVTHLFASLEYLTRRRDRQRGGANNWAVNRRTFHEHAPRLTRALDLAANDRVATALHVSRAVAAAALWLPLGRRQRVAANAVLTGSQAALHAQHLYGSDGADQVSFLVQALTTAARAGQRRPAVVDACLWFVALQSVLSYTVSGWAKLPSDTWRSGRALPGITRTLTYGDPQVWQLMRRYPRLTKLAAHGVLAMECAFPLAYAAKGRPAPYLLATAGAFHLVNARVMGLGRFFWAFTSTYPAVAYTTRPRERTGDAAGVRRDDTLPAVAATAGLVLFTAGQVARIRRRRLIERGRGDERTVTTAAGNVLSYRYAGNPLSGGAEARSGGSGGDGPVVVLESGMAATAEHWERIAGPLGDRFTTVTYQRAGYGASRYRGTGEYRFETMVDDLVELTRHVAGDRPVVLVGHSLGGYLALLAAEQLGGQVRGVALVDSSHPAELRRSLRQAEGGRALTSTLAIMPGSLRAGFGSLLPRAPWIDRLPESVRPLALAQYRDPELWAAARREWRVVQERFEDESTGLPRIDVPLVVVTAGRTARADAVQADLHDEFAAAAPRAQRHLIADADHDEILTDADRSAEVATILTAFVDDVTAPGSEVRR
ncbi:alpha/beta fold hydrolase [Micromonospora sp. HM134]|uniref:alpha/beta fold hydrolase n=1 Tax=Micromonospora sp. HM134 TaxID=2583243 RepID=UPI0011987968|nr:alpha/beta fold hydrolase [Micromonospora sp. HM134]QDY07820.1 alpha/beta fold hydrolase [Micromonospora sp. HM134]